MDQVALESLPEQRRNLLLRRIDWRFLLRREDPIGASDPLVLGFPSRRALAAARERLPAGGELLCTWRLPRPWGTQRARRRLKRAGFSDLRLLWPGPLPHRQPQFWLPPESSAAIEHLLSSRPASSPAQAALRALWRLAARLGLLAPVFALARAPGTTAAPDATGDPLAPFLAADSPCLLLTGGDRSINKVVALPFPADGSRPAAVVKFSRLAEADRALEREADALETVEQGHPELAGVPRLLARGRRAGGRALAESAIYGRPLIGELTADSFEDLAMRVTQWLVDLAGNGAVDPQPATAWWERLVGERLAELERNFGDVAGADAIAAARRRLEGLGDLPVICEHRDCSPWNVLLTEAGTPALLDWESAEPRGLPGLDLAYFLANAGFVLDGALDSGRTRESFARLLDPGSPRAEVAERCTSLYCAALGLTPDDFARLRLLAWIVHSSSDHSHLTMAATGAPESRSLRESKFLGLIEEELTRSAGTPG